ncbi:MAG TPA: recombinase family protein [Symbiobacteriaceae bacterium]|nr:recombinase family protein [Symbiobacteriaceae bacterium]
MGYSEAVDKSRVATYIRWSTDEQSDGTTLEVQLEACRLFTQSQGWLFREDLVFVDDGYSGGSLDRPGLNRLRAAVRDGEVSCVVIYKLDRLSRSVLDTVTLVLQEWEGICSVRSTREPVDTTNPTGSILFYMLASYAEWERSTIRERTLSGKVKRAQQGRNPGFTPPYGYRKGIVPGEWLVNEDEALVVKRVFREYIAGKGTNSIAKGLNDDGIRPRKVAYFNGLWLTRVIKNPIYMGVLRYGLSTLATKAQRLQGANARVTFDEPRHAFVEGAVPAIIPAEEFERAQQVKQARNSTVGFRNRGTEFLLSGIARCRCGASIRGDGREKNGDDRYYRCGNTRIDVPERCYCSMMPAHVLEAAVLAKVREELAPGNRELLLGGWRRQNQERIAVVTAELKRASVAMAQIAKKRTRIDDDYANGDLPAKLYASQIDRLDQEERALQNSGRALTEELERLESAKVDMTRFEEISTQLDSWEHLSQAERKQILRHAVGQCVVYREPGRDRAGKTRRYLANPNPIEIELEIRRMGS